MSFQNANIKSVNNGLFISPSGGNVTATSGTQVSMGSSNGSTRQKWTYDNNSKQITNASSPTLALGVTGSQVTMQETTTSMWQKWQLIQLPQNAMNIVSTHDSNICLQISDNGQGDNIVIGALMTPAVDYQKWETVY